MKKFLFIFCLIAFSLPVLAKHVTGGEVIYEYLGPGSLANSKKYKVTLRLFRDNSCTGCAAMPASLTIGFFNNDDNSKVIPNQVINLSATAPLAVISSPSCLSNPPTLNYSVGYYFYEIDLPDNTNGYSITYQTCCRVDNIANSANSVGSTFVGTIPGTNTLPNGNDNSPQFEQGISIICFGQVFSLNFSATDSDGDQLVYSLENAYNGGGANSTTGASFNNPAPPPYGSVPYTNGFTGAQCLGPLASINAATGIISGIAPGSGSYIVCVAVKSYRNGIFIAEHRKDFIVTVAPCTAVSAELKPTYTNCDNFDFSFSNESSSPLNLTFNWNFGDPASGANNNSTSEFPTHTYSAAGDFLLTLVVNQGQQCERTATSIVKVYPGYNPTFPPIDTACKNTQINFTSGGTLNYGVFNYWKWDFGVTSLTNDTSRLQNTTYSYTTAGNYNASLIVKSSKGCVDTLFQDIVITDSANLRIPRDTLICSVDTLQLSTNIINGTVTWSSSPNPNYMISDINSYNPLVSPDVTTTYTATYLSPSGCTATKSVTVKVVNDVTLLAINDTTICRTDTAKLILNTDALYFAWTSPGNPPGIILNPTVQNPSVVPVNTFTTFNVRASISNKCFEDKSIDVKTVPYPVVNITGDSKICFGNNANFLATGGSNYLWTPANFLNSTIIPNPVSVKPTRSISYTVKVTDTFGCPKPVFKTFPIEVVRVIANAGPQDTSIVLDQPLQLNATGGLNYSWTPTTSLSDPNIFNPIANPKDNITYTVFVSNDIGCKDKDTIRVKVFFLPPDIYVPSAFTPNKSGANDNFKPIPLGIKQLENFSVYNRFGELLFTTSTIGSGWDGTYKGLAQNPATYVWQATAIDYKGKKVFRKGTVVLIR